MIFFLKNLNSIGLIIDFIGAALIFFNSPEFTYQTFLYSSKEGQRLEKKAASKRLMARTGIALLGIGFLFQLASNLLK